jgi:hypothetical protein
MSSLVSWFVNFCFGRWLLFVFYRCKRQSLTKVRIGFAKSVNPWAKRWNERLNQKQLDFDGCSRGMRARSPSYLPFGVVGDRNHRGGSVNRRCEREQRVITSRSGALQNRTEGNEGNEDFADNVLEPILVFLVIFCFNLQKQKAATLWGVTADCQLRLCSRSAYRANWICPV